VVSGFREGGGGGPLACGGDTCPKGGNGKTTIPDSPLSLNFRW
jgi:hypothetical protein